jgi:hypothetical protein
MPSPYFQKSPWSPFAYRGVTYDLSHLDEYEFSVIDTDKVSRRIVVSFTDHCFTRDAEPGDDPLLIYPNCSRPRGRFCLTRYGLSLGIRKHIAYAVGGKVWNAVGENYIIISVVDQSGKSVEYGVFFSLDPEKGLQVLHMRVRTAFPSETKIATFGTVRFRNLVALRAKGKKPGKVTGPHRKAP